MTDVKNILIKYADKYETKDFLLEDPSYFMHQVVGRENQETFAFIASSLSYGSRKQFFPKIQYILDCSNGDVFDWVKSGSFNNDIKDENTCYYRLYTNKMMNKFLNALKDMINDYNSIYDYMKNNATDGYSAIDAFCSFFADKSIDGIIPKDTKSACKRICMFLRWMSRNDSPVDLGIWADIIDKRTLIMPLDTHVLTEACKLNLLNNRTASMNAAKKLTDKMKEIFPNDPLKGDFALFGYGVNH